MKKASFVLVEFLVAFSLFSMVATTLFGVYLYTNYAALELQKIEKKGQELRLANIKLQNLFCSLEGMGHNEKDIFYTVSQASPIETGTSLVFISQNEGDRDSGFASSNLAKLYHDSKEKMLCLASWPDPRKFPEDKRMHLLPILDQVEGVQFSFWLAPSMADYLSNTQFRQDELGIWLDSWKPEYKIMPTLMRMKVSRTGVTDPIVFEFVVSENIGAISYI